MVILTDERQLGFALEAFAWTFDKPMGWASCMLLNLREAGITSMNDLAVGCKDRTVNLDLELFGTPADQRLSMQSINRLCMFLPGPRGFRCFRLASKAVEKVDKGTADTEYVHRPENGKKGDENFQIPVNDEWILHVDCAGFVRSCLKHVTKDPFVMSLSDRDFMRAKDFFCFFDSVPYSVTDELGDHQIPESTERTMKWRKIPDLRMVIPGDIICYRPKGSAAGLSAFTTNDRKDIGRCLKAVKTAQLWYESYTKAGFYTDENDKQWRNLVPRNVAKDPEVRPWVTATKSNLFQIGIKGIKELYLKLDLVNDRLQELNLPVLEDEIVRLIRECCESRCENTGHIVFAAGPAVHKGNGDYRIRVVHSTKHGKKDDNGEIITGVQEYFRRFQLVEEPDGSTKWTRTMVKAKPLIPVPDEEDDDNPQDDMTDDEEDLGLLDEEEVKVDEAETTPSDNGGGDDVSGGSTIEVIAARMCF